MLCTIGLDFFLTPDDVAEHMGFLLEDNTGESIHTGTQ